MDNKLLLLHGISPCSCNIGGSKMAYKKGYNRTTRTYTKRRVRRNRRSFLGELGAGENIKASFSAVKGVMITGLIAAGGAVVTRKIFDAYGTKLNLAKNSVEESLALASVGIAGGILIAKLLKKPEIGTAFAIGPIVTAGMNLMGGIFGTGTTAGIGYIEAERPGFRPGPMALGATRVVKEGFQPQVIPMAQEASYGAY